MAHTMMMPLIYHPVLCHLEIPNEENFSGKTNFSVLIPYIVLLRVNLKCTMKSILIGEIDIALLICAKKLSNNLLQNYEPIFDIRDPYGLSPGQRFVYRSLVFLK